MSDQTTPTAPTTALAIRKSAADPKLFAQLTALLGTRDANGRPMWSLNKLATAMNVNHAYLSIYSRQDKEDAPTFPGNLATFEATLEDLLKNLSNKEVLDNTIFETAVTRQFQKFAGLVCSVNGVGVFHGASGLGKTAAIARYCQSSPLTIAITARTLSAGASDIVRELFAKLGTTNYNKREETKAAFILKRIRGRSGCIIIDNAHKLTWQARNFLFDLSDETEIPIVLVGNPDVIVKIQADAQQASRVGLQQEAKFRKQEALKQAVAKLMERELPEHAEALASKALQVASHPGHLRTLKQHLRVTHTFTKSDDPAVQAVSIGKLFDSAHETLIHQGYALAE